MNRFKKTIIWFSIFLAFGVFSNSCVAMENNNYYGNLYKEYLENKMFEQAFMETFKNYEQQKFDFGNDDKKEELLKKKRQQKNFSKQDNNEKIYENKIKKGIYLEELLNKENLLKMLKKPIETEFLEGVHEFKNFEDKLLFFLADFKKHFLENLLLENLRIEFQKFYNSELKKTQKFNNSNGGEIYVNYYLDKLSLKKRVCVCRLDKTKFIIKIPSCVTIDFKNQFVSSYKKDIGDIFKRAIDRTKEYFKKIKKDRNLFMELMYGVFSQDLYFKSEIIEFLGKRKYENMINNIVGSMDIDNFYFDYYKHPKDYIDYLICSYDYLNIYDLNNGKQISTQGECILEDSKIVGSEIKIDGKEDIPIKFEKGNISEQKKLKILDYTKMDVVDLDGKKEFMKQNLKKRMIESIFKQKLRELYIKEIRLMLGLNMPKNPVFVQIEERIPKGGNIKTIGNTLYIDILEEILNKFDFDVFIKKINKFLNKALVETINEINNFSNDDLKKIKEKCLFYHNFSYEDEIKKQDEEDYYKLIGDEEYTTEKLKEFSVEYFKNFYRFIKTICFRKWNGKTGSKCIEFQIEPKELQNFYFFYNDRIFYFED